MINKHMDVGSNIFVENDITVKIEMGIINSNLHSFQ